MAIAIGQVNRGSLDQLVDGLVGLLARWLHIADAAQTVYRPKRPHRVADFPPLADEPDILVSFRLCRFT